MTAGSYGKRHVFRGRKWLGYVHDRLLHWAERYGWRLEAWAVFSNHYHFVGRAPADRTGGESLRGMLGMLHADTAAFVNGLDGHPGRKVWHNYWETLLTFERSYLARLNYVHQNAVRHGLVAAAREYPWCSAAWFERTATPAQVETIYGFKVDAIRIIDDYEVWKGWGRPGLVCGGSQSGAAAPQSMAGGEDGARAAP